MASLSARSASVAAVLVSSAAIAVTTPEGLNFSCGRHASNLRKDAQSFAGISGDCECERSRCQVLRVHRSSGQVIPDRRGQFDGFTSSTLRQQQPRAQSPRVQLEVKGVASIGCGLDHPKVRIRTRKLTEAESNESFLPDEVWLRERKIISICVN